MLEFLRNWVLHIITLVVFILLLEILIPSGKTKKYINMVSGVILLIGIITPFLGQFNKGIDLRDFQMTSSNFLDRRQIEENSKLFQEKQNKQIVENYRKKIIHQTKETLQEIKGTGNVMVDVTMNEDYKSEKFGEIMRLYITLVPKNTNSLVKPVVNVEKIQIGGEKTPDPSMQSGNMDVDPEIRKKIEDKLYQRLEVQKETIVIAQQQR